MGLTESTPIQSNPPPKIRYVPGLELSKTARALLARAFAGNKEIFVEREFQTGFSGAVVLLVSPGQGQAPVVVKLAAPTVLQQEYAAYQQFVEKASPQNMARLHGEPLIADDDQLGLLGYTFVGGDPRLPTLGLEDYYYAKGGQAAAAVLDRVFRVYGRQWWAVNHPHKFVLAEQYDRLLPVHLKLEPAKVADPKARILVAGRINAATLSDLEPGQALLLKGFQVAKIRPDRHEVTLTANPPPGEASAPLRLRLKTEAIDDFGFGDCVESVPAVVTATRQTMLAEVACSSLPSFDPEAAFLTVGERSFLNPLLDLPDLLDRVIESRLSTIHGDLNLQNILVDEATGFAWLIDFAETRRGPTLFDLQRLESQIITKLLPPAIVQAGLEPAVIADLLESLHADPPSPTIPHPALQEPYTVLVTLRRLARQYLMDDRDWDEYYLGLVITLLGSLKYPELEPVGRELAVLGAATARGLIGVPFLNEITDSQGVKLLQRPRLKGGIALSGNVGGDLVISIGLTELVIPRSMQLAVAVIALGILFLVATQAIFAFKASQSTPAVTMTGDFNVAVAQFQIYGRGEGMEDAQKLAQGLANTIEREIDKLADDINDTIQIRFPQATGIIQGKTGVERAENAWILAKEVNAHVVIYGTIEVNGLAATIKPEFFVRDRDFTGAAEVTGQYRIGHEILLEKVDNRSLQNDVEETLKNRFRALAFIIAGLSDYVVGKYQDAENKFSKVLEIKAWDTPDVIYVLLGNTALKQREWMKAEKYYSEAQSINLDYARAYVGLGSVFLAQAMTDVQSERYDFDIQLLDKSINNYQKGLESKDQPPLADVFTRANFGMGEAYLQKALVEGEMGNDKASEQHYYLAGQAFQSVIQDYETGNKRVQELAAHAHARLGLLYWQTDGPEAAIPEFEQAIKLLPDYGQAKEDKAVYQKILDELR